MQVFLRKNLMQQKNIDRLIQESLAIEAQEAKEAGSLGFMVRALVQATMPHRKTEGNEFVRENGAFKLTILAPSEVGLPYGSIPRLLMAWLTTEAVKTKQRDIILGRSLSEFMSKIDIIPTGGRWGSISRLKNQMQRLFSSVVSCHYKDKMGIANINLQVTDEYQLWWEPKQPEQITLWESNIRLSERFFQEIINNPVPLNMDVLKAIKKSPLAIDIYCWVTYRMSYLKKPTEISWWTLQSQFGSSYSKDPQGKRNFKRAFVKELKKVQMFYPDAKVDESNSGLTLTPSRTHILSTK